MERVLKHADRLRETTKVPVMDSILPEIFVRRDHAGSVGHIDRLLRTGHLRRILPGVYTWTTVEDSFELRARAVWLWDPNAIFLGCAAARLTWWPECNVDTILVTGTRSRRPRPWLRVTSKVVPDDLVSDVGGARVADPALSVLEMASGGDGNVICEALRRGASTLASVQSALERIRYSNGNAIRRTLLWESRDEPWSPLEREAHTLLRGAGIAGWRTNYPVRTVIGKCFVDVALVAEMIAVELDGWEHHSKREAFDADRVRWNALTVAGWEVLHFTHRTLDELLPTVQRRLRHHAHPPVLVRHRHVAGP